MEQIMQDRFKFRYNNNNKIYDVSVIDFASSRVEIVSLDKMETLMCKLDLNNLIQCTGLKDKHSKLIYEGDIVRDLIIPQVPYIVKWFNGGFYLESTVSDSFLKFSDTQQEVIGNIYENSELLSEVK